MHKCPGNKSKQLVYVITQELCNDIMIPTSDKKHSKCDSVITVSIT